MADVTGVASLLSRVEEVEPPSELITRIAHRAPAGRLRSEFDVPGFWSVLRARWWEPLLQPKPAMGMAMTVLYILHVRQMTGAPQVQHLSAADLSPARVMENLEDRVVRTKDRLVKNLQISVLFMKLNRA